MKKLYIVKYKYDNTLEVIVENEKHFKKWLKENNDSRDAEPEDADEFELIPLTFYSPNN
jgi:heme/copper-type cytochrome/quinol oxidase subunit 2